ncbi:MAG: hypothetical protein WCD63_21035 [Terrimicrobiaceae bacterium]
MSKLFILNQYGILVDGGYRNDEIRATNKGKPLGASVSANQAQINHYNFQVENIILQEIVKRKTGQIILEGLRSSGWSVVIRDMWAAGETCNSTTLGGPEMHRGIVNVVVGFSPDSSCHVDPKSGVYPPGGSRAESLFHELVHAFRLVTEKASMRKLYSNPFVPKSLRKNPEYDFEEDFFAILITNIFSSETGRPLRGGHDSLDPLPPQLSTDKGFLAVEDYARLVRQFCTDHLSVSMQLRDVPSAFNPIREVLIGQGFQHLLNAR